MSINHKDIYDYLKQHCVGRCNAVKADRLASLFSLGRREINENVRALRKNGILIGSTKDKPYGYYIPSGRSEISGCIDTFRKETFDMLQTYNRMKRAATNLLEEEKQEYFFPETKQSNVQAVMGFVL